MKFKIHDGEKEYNVEEIEEKQLDEDITPIEEPGEVHDNELSAEEISALKQLAAAAPQLLALLQPAQEAPAEEAPTEDEVPEESDVVEVSEEDADCGDADEEEEEEEEKVVKTGDSVKGAAGSVIKTKSKDSTLSDEDTRELEVEEAYKNRYK